MSRAARISSLCLASALVLALGCSAKMRVPPRVDLAQWMTIGIVEFEGHDAPQLSSVATNEFVQMLQAAQPGARILELGSQRRLLSELDREAFDFEAVRAVGERYHVDAVFTGGLALSDVKPDVRFGRDLSSVHASANVNGELATKLRETRSGAVVWSRSSRATANVARMGVPPNGGVPSFRVGDPRDAYADLVPQLVANLRHDFYPTWVRR